jgi:hypothetical protein
VPGRVELVSRSMCPVKVYGSCNIRLTGLLSSYSPGYEYAFSVRLRVVRLRDPLRA